MTDGNIVPFDEYNRLVVESLSSQAAVVLNNHMLIQQQQKMNKIENDIQIARRIQMNFLPTTLPEVTGWEIGGRFQPAREVAGDFYDFFMMMNDRRLGIIIADVCDKGVGAALFMSLTRSLLRAFTMMSHNVNWAESLFEDPNASFSVKSSSGRLAIRANALKTAVVNTNEYITTHHLDLNMFATMFFGMLDPVTGTLLYINGGHPPVMIIAPDGTIKSAAGRRQGQQSGCSPARSLKSWTRSYGTGRYFAGLHRWRDRCAQSCREVVPRGRADFADSPAAGFGDGAARPDRQRALQLHRRRGAV